jgi:aspartate-semialdehyde dehydrogenase
MKIAVVGATGLVGRAMISVLEEYKIPCDEIIAVASSASYNTHVEINGKNYHITDNPHAIEMKPEVALFSAGGVASLEWAPQYAAAGITVIDNSSAWRMNADVPLVVPEVNGSVLSHRNKIIANPNCSTIGLVMVLHPLHQRYRIRRVVVSTYQAVSGTGRKALVQLENERKGIAGEMIYPYPIDLNIFPHGGTFTASGDTTEEIKLVNETRKILSDQTIRVSATVVRVPVTIGHSESVNIEFESDFDLQDVRSTLSSMKGVVVLDDPANNIYPMPILVQGKDEVLVGRIRRDQSATNALNLFLVSDNLRKGAASNAVQILQHLTTHHLLA